MESILFPRATFLRQCLRGGTALLLLPLSPLLLLTPANAQGLIVVSGDSNITNPLVGNSTAVDVGNQQFFRNVLGTGTRVLVQGTNPSASDAPVNNTNTFYNTLPGVTSTIQAGTITAASLAGVNLFVSALPQTAFTASEISALSAFSASGGSLFLLADGSTFIPASITVINGLLTGVGSGLSVVGANLEPGSYRAATGSQIASSALTTSVTSLTYVFTSTVSGGTTLFRTSSNSGSQTFIAAQNIPVVTSAPEPGSIALLGMGFAGMAGDVIRKRRKA